MLVTGLREPSLVVQVVTVLEGLIKLLSLPDQPNFPFLYSIGALGKVGRRRVGLQFVTEGPGLASGNLDRTVFRWALPNPPP